MCVHIICFFRLSRDRRAVTSHCPCLYFFACVLYRFSHPVPCFPNFTTNKSDIYISLHQLHHTVGFKLISFHFHQGFNLFFFPFSPSSSHNCAKCDIKYLGGAGRVLRIVKEFLKVFLTRGQWQLQWLRLLWNNDFWIAK